MTGFSGKTYWIVGASEGLGRELAAALSRAGASVVLSARTASRLRSLADDIAGAVVIPMDVTDRNSVSKAVEAAGPVDGVIYCAGRYEPMSTREWDADEAEAICEVNFMGAMRLLGRMVPKMIQRDSGHVVLIGSLSAHRGLPGAIGYGASKAALMSLAETMLADTRGTGIKVQIANPGFIQTRLTDKNAFHMPSLMTPEDAAEQIVAFMARGKFRTDFPVPFSLLFTLGKLLPLSIFHRIFRR
ncbi:SDR family NAD(P)-dependent oxidoreductase [Defluviimonas sp. WL0002]|uniref:SDR family NAD(P)-dependent oxidoreductase n=1 Tax=Albidovulum marisflavi TaxID=2984159 RepID=A0ABT2ZGL2_9RHOB|nr:SDR family NAD(P)-dependent oxidoreductase [Defluviimonas sp. WL0002]MCV2870260.1 SDR family NAD(P)-dependent oxidoreductase [Defluviimonas sp. WL0002]